MTKNLKYHWIGFSGRTLWEWLTVFLLPFMIGMLTIITALQQNQISQQQHASDQSIALANRQKDIQLADDQQRENVLVSYQKDISDLLLKYKLGSSNAGDPVRVVARAKTLNALRELDPVRKGAVIQFLYEAQLIGGPIASTSTSDTPDRHPTIIILQGADLRGADLSGIRLQVADLTGVDLSGAKLQSANLFGAYMQAANLHLADLKHTDLRYIDLRGADLREVDLEAARLKGAMLHASTLYGPSVDTNLKGARVTKEQLTLALTLKGATLPDGSKYPSQSYPIPNHVEP